MVKGCPDTHQRDPSVLMSRTDRGVVCGTLGTSGSRRHDRLTVNNSTGLSEVLLNSRTPISKGSLSSPSSTKLCKPVSPIDSRRDCSETLLPPTPVARLEVVTWSPTHRTVLPREEELLSCKRRQTLFNLHR